MTVESESSAPSRPIVIDVRGDLSEAVDVSAAQDADLLARDGAAASDAGDGRRADALLCARALLAERQGDDGAALALWRSCFERDPTLLIAFWGLRRALWRQGAWIELQGVLERRIAAIVSPARAAARAELLLERGRVFEDRLLQDDQAADSYRAGLIEVPAHTGLLTSLLLLGARCADPLTASEALAGFLGRNLPPVLRASMSATLARMQRTGTVRARGGLATGGEPAATPIAPSAAAHAFQTLRTALGSVPSDDAWPLVAELSDLAGATNDPALRAQMLDELVSRLSPQSSPETPPHGGGAVDGGVGPGGNRHAELAAALLRERARLLRDFLNDPAGAAVALRSALTLTPGRTAVIAELADAVEILAGDNNAEAIAGLHELLAVVAPGGQSFQSDAAHELALRYVTALAQGGRSAEGLAVLERHPELQRSRPDVFALEMLLRAATGDAEGMAVLYEHAAEGLRKIPAQGPEAAAHALVVAGTLLEGRQHSGASQVAGTAADDVDSGPGRLYRRAVEWAPAYVPALDAMERRLWATGRWQDLADFLRQKLAHLAGPPAAGADADAQRAGTAASDAVAGDALERCRVLEDLVAVFRDHLDDPGSARRFQEQLLATLALAQAAAADGVRARTRQHDLELGAAVHGEPSEPGARVQVLRELAAQAGVSELQSALRVEAARVALGGDDPTTAEGLLREALVGDTAGTATAGLERLVAAANPHGAATRAGLVRDEIARLSLVVGQDASPAGIDLRRALRFRVAWHTLMAGRAAEALDALGPLRAEGDRVAHAWSWEIARRSGQPGLQLAVLRAAPPESASELLELPTDLPEALEQAGDLPAAEAGFRDAFRKTPSTEAALGLLRVGAVRGTAAVVLEAARALAACADEATAPLLSQEVAMLSLLHGAPGQPTPGPDDGRDGGDDPVGVVLRWAAGVRDPNVLGAAAGLLAVARWLPGVGGAEAVNDRNGLLARAASRARMGGTGLAGAVHDQVAALSAGAAPIGVGLADLPVAGRPDRIAARIARAERNGGHLAYALDLECGLDAEARGDARAALDGFARAVRRDGEGIEALDGLKRVALCTGDRRGAARAGMRLATVLRTPARAAAEFGMAGQLWEDLGMSAEAAVAYWQALARDPGSEWLYERLRLLLGTQRDGAGLDRLYGHRLAMVAEPQSRLALLLERARHRLEHLDDRKAAIEDFKRMLKIDPHHPVALRQLATLAMTMEYFPQAVRFLDRLLGREGDEDRAASLRLELAEAHEAAREPVRAVEVLRRAASARPRDAAPWQRLIDLLLRIGDWPGALATLRSWDAVLADPIAKAEIWMRIGCLLRDHARDANAAASAFGTASELDPLGDGIRALVALHGQSGGGSARREALRRAIADMRQLLAVDPLDVPRLGRLKEMYEWLAAGEAPGTSSSSSACGDAAEGAMVAGQLLSLAGEDVALFPGGRVSVRGHLSADYWNRLRVAGAGGFAAEIWPLLAGAVSELFPAAKTRSNQRERVSRGTEPRLDWIEAAAAGVGLPTLEMWMPRKGLVGGDDESVVPIEANEPALLLGPGVLTGNATARFRVGRALALLRDRAVALERVPAAELATLFPAAGVVAGAAAPAAPGPANGIQEQARTLSKAMSRKDRKALELEASRFGFEAIDPVAFRDAVLATADRFGLIMAGDIAVGVRVTAELAESANTPVTSAAIVEKTRAMDLIRFALSDEYLALRRESGAGEV